MGPKCHEDTAIKQDTGFFMDQEGTIFEEVVKEETTFEQTTE